MSFERFALSFTEIIRSTSISNLSPRLRQQDYSLLTNAIAWCNISMNLGDRSEINLNPQIFAVKSTLSI